MCNCINYTLSMDDHIHKPASLVCDFTQITDTVRAALDRRQFQPVLAV
ncbi:MAG: hypothetical protein IJH37_00115 [Clostridia bacterium]|nr:hypothetical protein [Clostridia bacterium]